MTTRSDIAMEAYARLQALKDNLPEGIPRRFGGRSIAKSWIDEFHIIIALLEGGTGSDLSGFKMRGEEGAELGDRDLLMMKIDAVLKFFEIQWSEPKPKIGFHPK